MHFDWIWFLAGVLPYSIKRQKKGKMQTVTIRAFFWQLTVQHHKGGSSVWKFAFPLLEQFHS